MQERGKVGAEGEKEQRDDEGEHGNSKKKKVAHLIKIARERNVRRDPQQHDKIIGFFEIRFQELRYRDGRQGEEGKTLPGHVFHRSSEYAVLPGGDTRPDTVRIHQVSNAPLCSSGYVSPAIGYNKIHHIST